MKYVQTLVVKQVLRVLQHVAQNIDGVDTFHVTVKNEEDTDIGELAISRVGLQNMKEPRRGQIADDRRQAEIDTLGENKMWVKIEGVTVPSGFKRSQANK